MDLHCRIKRRSGVLWLAIVLLCAGCSDAAKLVKETETGGVVTYLYKEDRGGPVTSPHRVKALDLIRQKCGAGYVIVREGEAQGPRSVSGTIEGTEDEVRNRRWGLQFRCRTPDDGGG